MEKSLLEECAQLWGASVLHVFDRGYAGAPWLSLLHQAGVRFVLRWPARLHLEDRLGIPGPAWKHARGRKTRSHRQIWDAHHHLWRRGGVLALPVRHPGYAGPLWLVVSRRGKNHEPWYLLTNEVAETPKQMWRVVFAYARRWQIEMTFRFTKSELAPGEPAALVLGEPPEAPPDGRPRLRLPAQPPATGAGRAQGGPPETLLSPNRKAEPRCLDSALSPALGDLLPLPEPPNSTTPKFGMTHVSASSSASSVRAAAVSTSWSARRR